MSGAMEQTDGQSTRRQGLLTTNHSHGLVVISTGDGYLDDGARRCTGVILITLTLTRRIPVWFFEISSITWRSPAVELDI
jgi:hypothetical protein